MNTVKSFTGYNLVLYYATLTEIKDTGGIFLITSEFSSARVLLISSRAILVRRRGLAA